MVLHVLLSARVKAIFVWRKHFIHNAKFFLLCCTHNLLGAVCVWRFDFPRSRWHTFLAIEIVNWDVVLFQSIFIHSHSALWVKEQNDRSRKLAGVSSFTGATKQAIVFDAVFMLFTLLLHNSVPFLSSIVHVSFVSISSPLLPLWTKPNEKAIGANSWQPSIKFKNLMEGAQGHCLKLGVLMKFSFMSNVENDFVRCTQVCWHPLVLHKSTAC